MIHLFKPFSLSLCNVNKANHEYNNVNKTITILTFHFKSKHTIPIYKTSNMKRWCGRVAVKTMVQMENKSGIQLQREFAALIWQRQVVTSSLPYPSHIHKHPHAPLEQLPASPPHLLGASVQSLITLTLYDHVMCVRGSEVVSNEG